MDKNFKGTQEEYIEFRKKRNEANKRYYSKPEVKERKKKYKKQYDIDNKEKNKEYGNKIRKRPEYKERIKKWKEDNKEYFKEYSKTEKYKKMKRQYNKKYYDKKRKDKLFVEKELNRGREFRKNNPEKMKKYNQKYYTSHKGVINYTKHNHRRIALIKSRPFNLTKEKIKELFERDKVCVYCGSNKNLELDHLIPLNLGGNSLFINFVIACAKCNRSKSGREVIYWCKLQGIKVPEIVIKLLSKQNKD